MARIVVTGGAGFIGSHVVDLLVDDGHEVVVLDSLVAHGGRRPPWLHPGAVLVHADVRDPAAWRQAARGTHAVCHLAARVGLGVDFADVGRYVADNDVGTAVGLGALHDLGFSGRLILGSSMVVYGEGRYACSDHGDVRPGPRSRADLDAGRFEPQCPRCGAPLAWAPVDEDAPVDPRNVYAATKLHQEHLCAAFGREHGVTVTALRFHNVYGPRMPRDTPYAGVASIFRSAVARGEPPTVYEDGGQTRDFVHVLDVARANVAALTADRPVCGPVNVASGQPRTVLDLARALCRGTGLSPTVVGGGRLGDVRHVVACPRRATDQLGFRAVEPFRPDAVSDAGTDRPGRWPEPPLPGGALDPAPARAAGYPPFVLLTPRYDEPEFFRIELGQGDPAVPLVRQRRRLASLLADLGGAEWGAPSRCEDWSVRDVVAHLVDTNRFWKLSIQAALAGEPTRFLATFDPVASPAQLVDATRSLSPGEVLAALVETNEALAATLADLDGDDWSIIGEAPPGHVPLRAVALHALWDAWIHERDVVLPLGLAPVEEPDEVAACLAYAAALGPALAATDGDGCRGAVAIEAREPQVRLVVEAGGSVVIRDGDAPAGALVLTGAAVDLVEGLSFRGPLPCPVDDDKRWLLAGLAEAFDREPWRARAVRRAAGGR